MGPDLPNPMTIQDVIELVEWYRTEYPGLKAKVSNEAIEGLVELKTKFGIDAADEMHDVYLREIKIEIRIRALLELGLAFDQALIVAQESLPILW